MKILFAVGLLIVIFGTMQYCASNLEGATRDPDSTVPQQVQFKKAEDDQNRSKIVLVIGIVMCAPYLYKGFTMKGPSSSI